MILVLVQVRQIMMMILSSNLSYALRGYLRCVMILLDSRLWIEIWLINVILVIYSLLLHPSGPWGPTLGYLLLYTYWLMGAGLVVLFIFYHIMFVLVIYLQYLEHYSRFALLP